MISWSDWPQVWQYSSSQTCLWLVNCKKIYMAGRGLGDNFLLPGGFQQISSSLKLWVPDMSIWRLETCLDSPCPCLGLFSSVFDIIQTFWKASLSSINTPTINSQLALEYNLSKVKSRQKFKDEYASVKEGIRKISGGMGIDAYHAEKERRMSLPFPWPQESPEYGG